MAVLNVIHDPDQRGRVWHEDEVYWGVDGTQTAGLRVPNVGDGVFKNGKVLTVVSIDYITYIPTLEDGRDDSQIVDNTGLDSLEVGLTMHQPNILSRCYVDETTEPYTISFDARWRVWDSTATSMKLVFGGARDTGAPVISHSLDSYGNILSELVDLVQVNPNGGFGLRPSKVYTTRKLENGDIVTAICYNSNGKVCSESYFHVVLANMVAGSTASSVYIEDITLSSTLLSSVDPLLFENPVGNSFDTSMITAILQYSNGQKLELPIDGNRVILHGVSNFDTSQRGKVTDVVATYYPTPDEPTINVQGSIRKSISKVYTLTNIAVPGAYGLRVYILPQYQGGSWKLRYRLTSLGYDLNIDVTSYTTIMDGAGRPFDLSILDEFQRMHITVDLGAMNSIDYPGYIHVQKLDLKLPNYSSVDTNSWAIDYGCDGLTVYGDGVYAKVKQTGDRPFTIKCGQTSLDDWLNVLYRGVDPSFDPVTYPKAPTPTHFRAEHAGVDGQQVIGTYPITAWDETLYMGPLNDWDSEWPLSLVWINDNGVTKDTLAVSALPVKYLLA